MFEHYLTIHNLKNPTRFPTFLTYFLLSRNSVFAPTINALVP